MTSSSKEEGARKRNLFFGGLALAVIIFVVALSLGAGVDWFLAVVMAVVLVILMIVNIYLVVKWADPQDQTASYWLTVLLVFALTVAEGTILGLPLDVANNGNSLDCTNKWGDATQCGNLDMRSFWLTMMVLIFILVVFALPMAIFQYEAYDEVEILGKRTDNCGAFRSAIFYEFFVLAVTFLTLGLMFAFMGTAKIPLTELTIDATDSSSLIIQSANFSESAGQLSFVGSSASLSSAESCLTGCVSSDDGVLKLQTSFATYIAALTSWVGWFVFAVFGGVGLASVPIDFIMVYVNRPRLRDPAELARMQSGLQKRTNELIKLGTDIKQERREFNSKSHGFREKSRKKAADRTNVNKFKQMVYMLDKEFEDWSVSAKLRADYNPLMPYVYLFLGVFSGILSLLWLLQIILYILIKPPASQFLNVYFMQYDSWFPLFGTISVAMFSFYLLVCVISGLFKLGMRCFLITLHPMEYGKTLMNSFLFNILWILLCSIPVVQFCTEAFDSYARFTMIGTLLGVQVKYLEFFRHFYEDNIFVYILVVIMGLSLFYLLSFSRDKPASATELKHSPSKEVVQYPNTPRRESTTTPPRPSWFPFSPCR